MHIESSDEDSTNEERDNEEGALSEEENHHRQSDDNIDNPSSPPSPYSPQSINGQSDDEQEHIKNDSGNESPPSPYSPQNSDNINQADNDARHESDMEISAGSDDELNKNEGFEKQSNICDSPASPCSPLNSVKNEQSDDESHPKSDMDISAGSDNEIDNKNREQDNYNPASPLDNGANSPVSPLGNGGDSPVSPLDNGGDSPASPLGNGGDSPASPPLPGSDNEQSDNDINANDNFSDNENNCNETIAEDSVNDAKRENDNSDAESDIVGKRKQFTNAANESDQGDEEEDVDSSKKKKKRRARIADISDSDEENQEDVGHLEDEPAKPQSDDEEENFTDKYVEKSKKKKKKSRVTVSDNSDDESSSRKEPFVSDFDLMMQKKKESMRKRKRKNVDIINDSDDLIAEIITQMRQAAEDDKELNKQKKIALKKLQLLPLVMSQLKKHDLRMAFLEQGVLNAMADWLTPLPDRSLPNLKVREGMLRQLSDFPVIDSSLLKSSGIGRALMYLYRHPKELKENKERAGKLITEWARPIFNVTTDYHSLTKEEREQRDYDHIPMKKKKREDKKESLQRKDIDFSVDNEEEKIKPGDKNWVPRARVPMPSNKDYVVRPKWNVESEFDRTSSRNKKPLNRYEKHMKTMQEKKRNNTTKRAVAISIEGRNMSI